jgi:putative membrane protein
MSQIKSGKQYIGLFGRGALIGVANTVPGVSGGTIAVITGIYDELMESISHFIKSWKFLTVLFAGAGVGILVFAHLIEFLFENYTVQTLYSFVGLILGGIPCLWKEADFGKRLKPRWILAFFLAFAFIVFMGMGTDPGESVPIRDFSLRAGFLVFLSGVAGGAAMIVPGVSGSFLLLLMGMYTTFIAAVNDLNLPFLAMIGLGLVVGVFGVAKFMSICFEKYPKMTYAVIFGLIFGSVVTLWPGLTLSVTGLLSFIFIPLGIFAGYFLGDR